MYLDKDRSGDVLDIHVIQRLEFVARGHDGVTWRPASQTDCTTLRWTNLQIGPSRTGSSMPISVSIKFIRVCTERVEDLREVR